MSLKPLLDRKAEIEAEIEASVAEFRVELAEIDAEIEAHPASFTVADQDPEWVVDKVDQFVKRHLRRYPKTDCALALSLVALLTGESDKYTK